MIEDEEEKLEKELSDLRKQLKENPNPELKKKVKEKEIKLCKLLDYDMMLDTL